MSLATHKTILLLLLSVLGAGRVYAQDPIFDAKGFQQNRDYFSKEPFEHIDMVSGGLVLTFTDLVLPGNAGHDLRFTRTFKAMRVQEIATAVREDDHMIPMTVEALSSDEPLFAQVAEVTRAWISRSAVVVSKVARRDHTKRANR